MSSSQDVQIPIDFKRELDEEMFTSALSTSTKYEGKSVDCNSLILLRGRSSIRRKQMTNEGFEKEEGESLSQHLMLQV